MKIKLDENLPTALVAILDQLGHETDTVASEGLAELDDQVIWEAAQIEQRFLITQDLDFSDIRRYIPGTHYDILLVRLHQPGRAALIERLQYLFETEAAEQWQSCFVVATDHKLRIRRPANG